MANIKVTHFVEINEEATKSHKYQTYFFAVINGKRMSDLF